MSSAINACPLLHVPADVRLIIYEYVFAGTIVRIYGQHSHMNSSPLPHMTRSTFSWDTATKIIAAPKQYEIDNLDKCITDKHWDEDDLESQYKYADYEYSKAHNWEDPQDTIYGFVDSEFIDNSSLIAALDLLRTCKQISDEAQPLLRSMTELELDDMRDLQIKHLPLEVQTRHLPLVRKVTLKESDNKHDWMFNLRQLPALQEVKILGHVNSIDYIMRSISSDPSCHSHWEEGDVDEYIIGEWFEDEMRMYSLEEEFVSGHEDEDVRAKLREKNRGKYWLRDLLHGRGGVQRHFRVIRRLQVNIYLYLIKPGGKVRFIGSQCLPEEQRIETVTHIDLDFDIDTREVVWRKVWAAEKPEEQ